MSLPIYVITTAHAVRAPGELRPTDRIKLWCHEGGERVRSDALPPPPADRSRPPCNTAAAPSAASAATPPGSSRTAGAASG